MIDRLPWPTVGKSNRAEDCGFRRDSHAGFRRGNGSDLMREYVWLECTSCGDRNYRVQKETRGANRLELKKYCRRERKHTAHKESRKK
jgi:large subunit ribosomal protein L33